MNLKRINGRTSLWSVAIAVLLAGYGLAAFAQSCVQPPSGIVAWWPMDETSGTTVRDIVGTNPGIHVNGPAFAPGRVAGALRFNGGGSYVGAPDSDLWAFGTNDFTIELWANWDSVFQGSIGHPGTIFIGNDEGAGTQNKWFFALGGGVLNFHINGPATGSVFLVQAPFSPTVGVWYHLAVTKSGSTYSIYVNGTLVGTATDSRIIPNAASALTIGQAESLGFMNGRLDEVSIYSRALAQSAIQAIASAGDAGKCKFQISTKSLPAVKFGGPALTQLQAAFGQPPFSWAVSSGALPAGMSLSGDGVLSGTPTEAGEFPVTVRLADGAGNVIERGFSQQVLLSSPPPRIRARKSGTLAVPGRTLDYFIVVENTGDVSAENIPITEFIQPWFTFISADPMPSRIVAATDVFPLEDPSAGKQYEGFVDWMIGTLRPGEVTLLSYKVALDSTFPLGESVRGSFCLWGDLTVAEAEACRDRLIACLTALPNTCLASCTLSCRLAPPGGQQACFFTCISRCPIVGTLICEARWAGCMTASGSERCFSDQQQTAGPHDPNEKQVVNARFIRPDELLVYPIHFENTGNAEARDVFVTDVLDANLDPSTVNLITPNGGSFDSATRTVKWSLLSRNLQPGQTGNVLVAARPRPGLPAGTEIRNKAVIQFEVFDPMTTNEVVNIIDDVAPHCAVTPLPGEISAPAFTVSWTGTDAVGEVDSYSVWVSTDGSAFTALLENTKDTGTTFQGAPGKRYGFLCVAKDTAGNIEIKGAVAETSTTVALNFAPTANAGVNRTVRVGSPVTLHGEGSSDADSGPQPLMFSWSQVSGPSVVLSGPSTSNPTFTPTTAGSYVFRLTVSDGIASSGPADVAITVPKLGDIDGDGAVDNSDLSLILAARNTSASGPNDLRDLDGDGMITALDARKLTTLCTRPRCAVQ